MTWGILTTMVGMLSIAFLLLSMAASIMISTFEDVGRRREERGKGKK